MIFEHHFQRFSLLILFLHSEQSIDNLLLKSLKRSSKMTIKLLDNKFHSLKLDEKLELVQIQSAENQGKSHSSFFFFPLLSVLEQDINLIFFCNEILPDYLRAIF